MREIGITVRIEKNGTEKRLEIDPSMTAAELAEALNKGLGLGIPEAEQKNLFFISFRPLLFLQGGRKLAEAGVRSGSLLLLKGTGT